MAGQFTPRIIDHLPSPRGSGAGGAGRAAERNSGQLGVRPGNGQDPLGRRPGSSGIEALEGVKIPDRMELRRAREILDELRRRRGDRNRPVFELDYIDRLLRQF